MDAAELLNHLYADLITSPKTLDLSQKSLQLHFATQLRELLEEDKLNPSVKAEIKGMLYKLEKFAKKKSKTANQSNKNHFNYLKEITQTE
jgi:hypothetical protein